MKKYEIIVVGSGCGMLILDEALGHGLSTALVDKGPFGGTCLNVGCIPSKMLIHAADRIMEMQEARKLGIEAQVVNIDFEFIMDRMRHSVRETRSGMRQAVSEAEDLDFYEGVGRFTGDYTIEVNGEEIQGKKIFIASGSRPSIPPIRGLDSVSYLTNETVLQLKKRPGSMVIVGGGYVGCEYAHFFAAMGTRVTLVEVTDRLVAVEEPEIAGLLRTQLSTRMDVRVSTRIEEVSGTGNGGVTVRLRDTKTDTEQEITSEKIMVAAGRISNADLLEVEKTGVATDGRGFIQVNEYLETSKKHIFAVGDINGQQMFTHVANREAVMAIDNVLHDAKSRMDYHATPHAVYSHPQIASVGLTEAAAAESHRILVGKASYFDVAKGEAMMEKDGFAKAVVEGESGKILGFHIVGPYAPILIQEVINVVASGGHFDPIIQGIHIHPALPELIQTALGSLEER